MGHCGNLTKYIVITSINQPTEAIIQFSKLDDYQLVVVGDKKTPSDWKCERSVFLSHDNTITSSFKLHSVLPYNHYCRKMLGYLFAIKNGADCIIDTDDDNIPKGNWSFPPFEGIFAATGENKGFINIYEYYTNDHIWPRGLPLRLINQKNDFSQIEAKPAKVGIWQGLADEDPDVDAVYRLTSDKMCIFEEKEPLILGRGTITPFNTQNTMIRKELFPLLYLPTYVTFRFTDILRGLIAQPVLWMLGYHLGFTNATVIQKRNPHDYFQDFISELPMYQHTEDVLQITQSALKKEISISENLYNIYDELRKAGIVQENEMTTLEAWLEDITSLT